MKVIGLLLILGLGFLAWKLWVLAFARRCRRVERDRVTNGQTGVMASSSEMLLLL
tara:strand:+ start:390 stop:554 length:165 start_codon:yes stop_codon:yes gene_type:complete